MYNDTLISIVPSNHFRVKTKYFCSIKSSLKYPKFYRFKERSQIMTC